MSVPTLKPAALTARIEEIASTCRTDNVAAAREPDGNRVVLPFDVLLDRLDAWEARTSG
jgi:hypothetical protein